MTSDRKEDIQKLSKGTGGRFKLTTLMHKRMRQLTEEGYRPSSSGKLMRSAMTDIQHGDVSLAPSAVDKARAFLTGKSESELQSAKQKASKQKK